MTQHGQTEEARRSWKTSATGKSRGLIKWSLRTREDRGSAWWRDARSELRRGWRCRFNSYTSMSWTPWSLWRRETPPHPRCTRCNILVPRQALNGRHPATAQCARGAEKKRRWLAEAELREILERDFEAYGEPPEKLTAFRYLGWVLMEGDGEWIAVLGNLGEARKSWGRLSRILSCLGYVTLAMLVCLFVFPFLTSGPSPF